MDSTKETCMFFFLLIGFRAPQDYMHMLLGLMIIAFSECQ